MLDPCKLRWTKYNDYYTGKELLGASTRGDAVLAGG